MYLIEQAEMAAASLPISEFRDHLRLGSGFSDDAFQDAVLEQALRSAIAQVESHCAKAILTRQFVWTLAAWRDLGRQVLPRAPLVSMDALTLIDLDGQAEIIDPKRYSVQVDAHRPAIVAKGFVLPQITVGGRAELMFTAGFGEAWAQVPAGARQAILELAASAYENRTGSDKLPASVIALLAPYRQVRLFGGRW